MIAVISPRVIFAFIIVNGFVNGGKYKNVNNSVNRRLTKQCHALCRELTHAFRGYKQIRAERSADYEEGSEAHHDNSQNCISLYRHCKHSAQGRSNNFDNYRSHTRLANRCHSFCRTLGSRSRSPPVRQICNAESSIGGSGGEHFSDASSASGKRITAIKLHRGSEHIEQIQVRYGSTWATSHPNGEKEGTYTTHELQNDEYITSIYAKSDNFIKEMTITTNKRTLPTFKASDGGSPSTQSGRRLMYISGREGAILDRLTFHWKC